MSAPGYPLDRWSELFHCRRLKFRCGGMGAGSSEPILRNGLETEFGYLEGP